jgi:hypothetical protein
MNTVSVEHRLPLTAAWEAQPALTRGLLSSDRRKKLMQ